MKSYNILDKETDHKSEFEGSLHSKSYLQAKWTEELEAYFKLALTLEVNRTRDPNATWDPTLGAEGRPVGPSGAKSGLDKSQ